MICENLGQGVYSTSCCTLIGRDTFLLKLDCVAFFLTTSLELDNMATELKCNNFLVQVLCFGWNTDFLCFDDYINLRHSKNAQKLNIWTSYEFKQLKWNRKNFDFAVIEIHYFEYIFWYMSKKQVHPYFGFWRQILFVWYNSKHITRICTNSTFLL